jgi:uncharacterized membrane protein
MMVIDEPGGVASLGAGMILLTAALFRRWIGRRSGFVLSIVGILLVAVGIADLGGKDKDIPLFATALIAFGALIVVKALSARRWIRDNAQIVIRTPDDQA